MSNFVQVTHRDSKDTLWVNLDHIESMAVEVEDGVSYTALFCIDRGFKVLETPEYILSNSER